MTIATIYAATLSACPMTGEILVNPVLPFEAHDAYRPMEAHRSDTLGMGPTYVTNLAHVPDSGVSMCQGNFEGLLRGVGLDPHGALFEITSLIAALETALITQSFPHTHQPVSLRDYWTQRIGQMLRIAATGQVHGATHVAAHIGAPAY